MKRTITGIYDEGTIRFRNMKLGRKLPLRNHTVLRFTVELPKAGRRSAFDTFGILRVPKRLARAIAESPAFSLLNS